ncbi:MAG: alpha/beta hydrolase [Labilithrix sp.]|nr:alpha/beta hydrolase [Labilithrix sp.]
MPTVKSVDGTPIGYTRTGRGAPLVLVHGISADAERWAPVMQGLEASYTVYAMDRRGRGMSGDHASYALEREFEDVAAVVDAVGEPAYLLGHSYGGLCALHAMLRTKHMKKLLVYEPYAPVVAATEPSAITLRYEALAASGERDAVVTTFLREIVQLTENEVRLMRAHPSWAARLAAAHTIPRELRAAEQFSFEPERFAGVTTAIAMFVGQNSPDFLKDATARLSAVLRTSEVIVLDGQKHAAMNTAPSLFVRAVNDALLAPAQNT